MFKHTDIVTAVEIGSSKICVVTGEVTEDEPLRVIDFAEEPVEGEVVKGEIADMDRVLEKLIAAFDRADTSKMLNKSRIFAMNISGCNIASRQESAALFVDGKVSAADLQAAADAIEQKTLSGNLEKFNIADSYYVLDDVRRVRNPIDQNARKFELFSHVIFGDANRINNFRTAFIDAGFEEPPSLIFSGLADLYAVVSQEEREHGALLVDVGRGTTEYIAIFNDGVFASGVIPVGFDHLANDLSIGLNLPLDVCRGVFTGSLLQQPSAVNSGMVEVSGRRIPLASFEKIIDLRLRELFTIVRNGFPDQSALRNLASGGILTGGGALFPRTAEIFHSMFDLPVRIGAPYDHEQDLGFLADPRYSSLWGSLCYAAELLKIANLNRKRGMFTSIFGALGNMGDSARRTITDLKDSIKL